MPIHEFKCDSGHITERFFKTFEQAEGVDFVACDEFVNGRLCNRPADRVIFSRTLEPMFYGNPDGYAKPSPTKRFNTKTVSQKEGNKNAIG